MNINLKILLISAVIVAGIYLFKFLVSKLADKAIHSAQNKIDRKKSETHIHQAGKEQKLSDLYNKSTEKDSKK